jgi:hypothetical protein
MGLPIWYQDVEESEWNKAELLKKHPTRPTAIPSLQFFKHRAAGGSSGRFYNSLLSTRNALLENILFKALISTAQRLHCDDHAEESRWLLDFGRDRRPDIFTDYGFALRSPKAIRESVGQNLLVAHRSSVSRRHDGKPSSTGDLCRETMKDMIVQGRRQYFEATRKARSSQKEFRWHNPDST